MNRKLIQLLILLGIVAFIVWISFFGRNQSTAIYIEEITAGYKGVVVEIYFDRSKNLKIKTEDGDSVSVGMLCSELIDSVNVGDSIEKVANENYVFLTQGNKKTKKPYLYLHERIRSSSKWPKEWKDKWPESTY